MIVSKKSFKLKLDSIKSVNGYVKVLNNVQRIKKAYTIFRPRRWSMGTAPVSCIAALFLRYDKTNKLRTFFGNETLLNLLGIELRKMKLKLA